MTDRVTRRDLEGLCRTLNRVVNGDANLEPYRGKGETFKSIDGVYVIDGAYGGWALHRISGEHGGVSDIIGGHMPARELYYRMHAYLDGFYAASAAL